MRKLPKPIRPVLEDSSIGPMGILESPQPHIFEINESLNLNIKSVRVNSISLCFGSSMDKNKGKVIPKHSLQDDTWIHMGLYGMDLDLLDSNIIPTVPYDVVRSAEFYKVPELSVKVCDYIFKFFIFLTIINSLTIYILLFAFHFIFENSLVWISFPMQL